MRTIVQIGVALLLALGTCPAQAAFVDLEISQIENLVIEQGQPGTIDIRLIGNTDVTVFGFYLLFEIQPIGNEHRLEFVQTDGFAPDGQLGEDDYIFALSSDAILGSYGVGTVGPGTLDLDAPFAGYAGIDTSSIGVTGEIDSLLVRLDLTTMTDIVADRPQGGDQFEIVLVGAYIFDADGNFIDYALESPNSTIVNITSSSAPVPEPSSICLFGGGLLLFGLGRLRRSIARIG